MKPQESSRKSFLRDNEGWMTAMLSSAVVFLSPMLFKRLFAASGIEIPHWMTAISLTLGAIGAVIAYFRARMTNTLTAQIAAGLMTALIEIYALVELFEWLATLLKH